MIHERTYTGKTLGHTYQRHARLVSCNSDIRRRECKATLYSIYAIYARLHLCYLADSPCVCMYVIIVMYEYKHKSLKMAHLFFLKIISPSLTVSVSLLVN